MISLIVQQSCCIPHMIDNIGPGFNVVNASGNASFRDRLGNSQTLNQLTETSNYDLEDPTNELLNIIQ